MKVTTLYNGVAGVLVHEKALNSVSDNLANVSTYGFKHTRANFADMVLSQLSYGSANGENVPDFSQVGNGAVVSMQNMMIQGNLESTENVTDLAVSGRGFFAVRDANQDSLFYTRAGNFILDQDGYMVNPTGHRLQGFTVNSETGAVTSAVLADIQIPVQTEAEATATSQIEMAVNLNADDPTEFKQNVDIDPTDATTYNYSTGITVYDSQGNEHQLVILYQKLESYTGAAPDDSSGVWKAAVFERVDGSLERNPPDNASGEAQNYFYLHFDTDGHMVGTSGLGTPQGEVRTLDDAAVSSTSSDVSNRTGETFSFTGDGDAQTFISTQSIDLNSNWDGTDTLTLTLDGGGNYTYSAATYSSGADLAAAINQDSPNSGVWADYDSSRDIITLYGSGNTTVETTASDSSITISNESLTDLVQAIDNGRSATGAIAVAGTLEGGEQITINSTTLTFAAGSDASDIAQAINDNETLSSQVTAKAVGDSVFITANSAGTDANGWTLAVANDGDNDLVVSGNTLAGGMDSTDTTQIDASTTSSGSNVALRLSREDLGSTATVTISGGSLGTHLATPLDFSTSTQNTAPVGGPSQSQTGGSRDFTFTFTDDDGNSTTQQITVDYIPGEDDADPYVGSTSSAGSSVVTYLDQDGTAGGSLKSLEITDTGIIWGLYTDDQRRALAAVGLTGFVSPESLQRQGNNLWRATDEAGDPVVGSPLDDNNLGKLVPKALEVSTVDVATEMVNMINYQRAFQANSKSITTADEMLKTAINLRR